MSDLLVQRDGALLTATINRPEQRNTLSPAVVTGLLDVLERAEADGVRVVVITGSGDRAFCAGADLGSTGAGDGGAAARHHQREHFASLLRRLRQVGVPVIARVNGAALAGGFGLALGCDLVISADSATFGTPEVKVGMWPYMITAVITEHLGPKRTMDLLLSGRRVSAEEALSWGLVNRVVAPADLDGAVQETVDGLLASSPVVLSLGKQAYARATQMNRDDALDYLAAMLSLHLQTEDVAEGIAAFLEKRPPEWKGR